LLLPQASILIIHRGENRFLIGTQTKLGFLGDKTMDASIEKLFQEGIEFFRMEAYLDAFLSFDRALKLQPDNPLLWGWRGRALTQMSFGHLCDLRERLPEQYADSWIAGEDATVWWQACHAETLVCLTRALELNSEDSNLWEFLTEYWLQQAYYHNSNHEKRDRAYKEALAAIARAIELAPNSPQYWNIKLSAIEKIYFSGCLKDPKQFLEAEGLQSAEQLIALMPNDAQAWNIKAKFLHYLERHEEALRSYDRALNLTSDPELSETKVLARKRAYEGRGHIFVKMERDREALESYEESLKYAGASSKRYQNLANQIRERITLANIDYAVEAKPGNWKAWHDKAKQHVEREEYQSAIPCYDRILEIQPDSPDILKERGIAFSMLGNSGRAIANFDLALTTQPNNPELWYQKGKTLLDGKQYEAAIAAYDHLLTLEPNHPAIYDRGTALWELNRFEAALDAWDRFLEHPFLSAQPEAKRLVWYHRSLVLINLNRYEEAFLSFRRFSCKNSDDPEDDRASVESLQTAQSWFQWGKFLTCNGSDHYREAVPVLKQAIALGLHEETCLSMCAYALLRSEQFPESIQYYRQALDLNPENAGNWHNLSLAQECLGNYEDAIASCDRALTIKPDDPQTLTHLGDLLRQVGRFQEAMTACDRALELKPNYTDAFYTKAVIFALQGDTNQVLVNLREYVRLATTWEGTYIPSPNYAETLAEESAFDSLRSHPEFQALMQEAGVI
jgi:tetratricopeptide (TPR) repeat protein